MSDPCKRCGGSGREPVKIDREKKERNKRMYDRAVVGASNKEIAAEFGISVGRVFEILRRAGFSRPPRGVMQAIKDCQNLKDFSSAQAIADHFLCKYGTVRGALWDHPQYPELKESWKRQRHEAHSTEA